MPLRRVEHLDVLIDVGNIYDVFGIFLRVSHHADVIHRRVNQVETVLKACVALEFFPQPAQNAKAASKGKRNFFIRSIYLPI